jgi:histidinol dehydrogenase/sulfopropanediol 3-dehydrogenase
MAEYTYLKEVDESSLDISPEVTDSVRDILDRVRDEGDEGVHALTRKFDDVDREALRVGRDEIDAAAEKLTEGERKAIDNTVENVREFHEEQRQHIEGFDREFQEGVTLGQRILPMERVGVYIPGGRHPLVATPAMTIVPAKIAGVEEVVACAPPGTGGTVQPAQLYAMDRAGVDEVYCIGGAQAIGAMAYGTESIDSVDFVAGPGNVFTTEAKRQVYGHVGIDFLAGPSEVLILADETSDPEMVATDLLAQAEHDPNARAVVISIDEDVLEETLEEMERQFPDLRTEETARESWEQNGEAVLAAGKADAIELANDYAMEHVQIMTDDARSYLEDFRNYGSMFLGHHAPVVFGDKAVGTNHSLPTLEVSRYSSGIWIGTYLKTPTHQELTREGAARIAPWAAKICEIEGTHAHQISAEKRILSEIDTGAPALEEDE